MRERIMLVPFQKKLVNKIDLKETEIGEDAIFLLWKVTQK